MAGFWKRLITGEKSFPFDTYDAAQRVLPEPYEPFFSTGGIPLMDPGTPLRDWIGGNADAAHMWRTQPSVRKVIGFAARNVASIPLHVHERVSDNERRRVTDHPLARVMASPRPGMGAYRFWEAVISDGLLYDRWAVLKRYEGDGSVRLSRIPSWRLRFVEDNLGEVDSAWYWTGEEWTELDLDALIYDYGYAPKSAGLSPIETLSDLLDESAEAVEYRREVWANGARAPQYIARPAGQPWSSDTARDRFVAGMRAFVKKGPKAGGMPLLEDGMEIKDGTRMSSKDMLDLEGRKLSDIVVASAWHIAPELIGAREGNFSNIDAFRQMLYGPSLGPYITAWEQAINVGLTPDLDNGRPLYVEANVEAKLRGSFIEQAQVLSTAIGAPWMVRNEGRALANRPPIEGGDELVTPLNVLVGGQASPRDGVTAGRGGGSAPQPAPTPELSTVGGFTPAEIVALVGAAATLIRSGFAPEASLVAVGLDPVEHLGLLPVTVQKPQAVDNPDEEIEDALKVAAEIHAKAMRRTPPPVATVKTRAPESHEERFAGLLKTFFARQGRAVRGAVGAGRDWWDEARWDKELSEDLLRMYALSSETAARSALEAAGLEDYDVDRTLAFLKEAAERSARDINAKTRDDVTAALGGDDPTEAVTHTFDVAESQRSGEIAATVVTFASGFGVIEAAKQHGAGTKTWRTTSGNPRSSHAAMDGETVDLDANFSNGLKWPGSIGDPAEVANCRCAVDINF